MIYKVQKAFPFNGHEYKVGDTIKLGTRDYKALSDKVVVPEKFTKVVGNKRIK